MIVTSSSFDACIRSSFSHGVFRRVLSPSGLAGEFPIAMTTAWVVNVLPSASLMLVHPSSDLKTFVTQPFASST